MDPLKIGKREIDLLNRILATEDPSPANIRMTRTQAKMITLGHVASTTAVKSGAITLKVTATGKALLKEAANPAAAKAKDKATARSAKAAMKEAAAAAL